VRMGIWLRRALSHGYATWDLRIARPRDGGGSAHPTGISAVPTLAPTTQNAIYMIHWSLPDQGLITCGRIDRLPE
jgi:hypothetical protein